jgi:16S rRNA (guanine(966)-N(2))-methyltransferase RsmD
MDRVKAAIFSSLADKVFGARVLDLFAGTGGLGIEALSRGASSALFVDHDRQAIGAIETNLKKARVAGKIRPQDVFEFLRCHSGLDGRSETLGQFDLIFADPPYEHTPSGEGYTDKLLQNRDLLGLLKEDGIFILEKRPAETLPEMSLWNLIRQKKYGTTEVLFLARRATWHRLAADGTAASGRYQESSDSNSVS